jgi:hypothetical protein
MTCSRQRLYAALLFFGINTLLFRTIVMLLQGDMVVLVFWAAGLLILEFVLDTTVLFGAARWFASCREDHARFPLRTTAAAVIVHAVRVLIFILGRVGPWFDFDVRPEHRALHPERWSWSDVYFAGIMTALGLLGLILIWRMRRRYVARKRTEFHP